MTAVLSRFVPFVLVVVAAAAASGADLIPTPNFSDHEIPFSTQPSAPSPWYEYFDVAALAVALALASYFALVSRSRKGLFLLTIVSLAWFGFWRKGCVCAIGATQNVALAVCDPTYVIPVSVVAFFTLPLIFTLFFGRTFCAAVCPLGAVQELVAVHPIRVPKWLDHALGLIPYLYLGAAVAFAATGTAFLICRYDPFVGFFRLSGSVNMLVFGGCLLVIGLFVGRPYCRYLCPYGAILGLLSKVSKWHARIPPEECINCRLCEDVCPYEAIQPPTVDQPAIERPAARRRLVILLLVLPVLIGGSAYLGSLLAVPMSRLHGRVRLAEQVEAEEAGTVEGTTDASDAFRNTGEPVKELYEEVISLRTTFRTLGICLGAWVGLVIGVKLIHLSIRRRRVDYQIDRTGCVSCARCFWYCPCEQLRLGLIKDVSELTGEAGEGRL